jgi:hypothetical protein
MAGSLTLREGLSQVLSYATTLNPVLWRSKGPHSLLIPGKGA